MTHVEYFYKKTLEEKKLGHKTRKIISVFIVLLAINIAQAAEEDKKKQKAYSSSTSLSILRASGNSNEFSLGFDTEQNLDFEKSQFNFKGSAIYAESEGTRDTEFYFSQLNYRYSFEPRFHGVASAQLERNVLSGYNYRFSLSAGAGYFWIKSKKLEASSEAALGWNGENNIKKESDSNVSLTFISMSIANSIKIPLSSNSELNHQNIFFFNLKTGADFRINSISSVSFSISKVFSIKISHQLKYNHCPVPGFKNTDQYLLSSLVLKF